MLEIRRLDGAEAEVYVRALALVLHDCVEGGASVSFMAPFDLPSAERYFQGVARSTANGERVLLAAFLDGELVGSVQILLATPPNQPHRADIAKLLVLRSARRQGIAEKLLRRAEEASLVEGKSLLVLDTVTGGEAERIYLRLGWTRAGVIPNYALFPDGTKCDTTIFWKQLRTE